MVLLDKNTYIFKYLVVYYRDSDILTSTTVIGYDIIRKDRSRRGGGVCVYLRSSISYKLTRNDLVPDGLEAVCLEICKSNSRNFIVASVYRPPDASSAFFYNFSLSYNQIQTLCGLFGKNYFLRS
jgi:hypothetical protein